MGQYLCVNNIELQLLMRDHISLLRIATQTYYIEQSTRLYGKSPKYIAKTKT